MGVVNLTRDARSKMSASGKGRPSSRRGGSTLQKIAQKKEQLKLLPRMKKIERICVHLSCQVSFHHYQIIEYPCYM